MSVLHTTRPYSAQRRTLRSSLARAGAALVAVCFGSAIAGAADGDLDTSFGATGDFRGANGIVLATTAKPDGKILIGGQFSSYDNIARNSIAQLNADGSLDTSFDPGTGIDPTQSAIDAAEVAVVLQVTTDAHSIGRVFRH